jgi:hypothetical protein
MSLTYSNLTDVSLTFFNLKDMSFEFFNHIKPRGGTLK